MKGAIAAGSEAAVDAGIYALRKGGNAIDALISAQLTATVSEPLLTGLCGSGIAILHNGTSSTSIDMFSTHPGLGEYISHDLDTITINFGPTSQDFSIGLGSIATPTLWKGILELHSLANLPLATLAEPAIQAARNGIHVNRTLAYVLEILWPICSFSKGLRDLFSIKNRRLIEGDIFYAPQMALDIENFVEFREHFFTKGRISSLIWPFLQERSSLTKTDVLQYEVRTSIPKIIPFHDSQIILPGAPSIGSEYVSRNLLKLSDDATKLDIIDAQVRTCQEVDRSVLQEIFTKSNESTSFSNFSEISAGFTSHISVVDGDGFAAGLTSSLGESCGYVIPETGLIMNNFLGEDDVCPEFIHNRCGERLMTMCTPTIIRSPDSVTVMGSGGSTRIRTAILHGIVNTIQKKLPLSDAIHSPRIHIEPNLIQLELYQQPENLLQEIKAHSTYKHYDLEYFDEPSMFFGGLHSAKRMNVDDDVQYFAIGDPRRDGVGKVL